ncbi:glycoside hydrolase family 30 protein [Gracilibacillus xinjiangensis]|uniref:Glycoside hydrolase family 30 beta sandwich domain-containing protein n=1 Tax=Gracilibacillus xinjiangensis TaxID=1193282 RepID=A0ABV8WSN5_9BACI
MIISIIPLILPEKQQEKVNLWLTTSDQSHLLSPQESLEFDNIEEGNIPTIQVDPTVKYQTMDGFGAAITGSSAYLISHILSSEQRNSLLNDLFTKDGIRISYIRHTIGASDFSVDENGNPSSYTYNDIESGTDFALENFSIEKDKDIIKLLQDIDTTNNQIKILGTPWTAPAWMKYGYQQLNGWYLNYKDKRIYETYADYFVKYIQIYKSHGVSIDAITIQNEPEFTSESYPSMSMGAEEQAMFIKNYLGPAFSENNLSTKIIGYDHNWNNGENYSKNLLKDKETRKYVDGTAFHCYEGEPASMSSVHNSFPSKNIYLTECSGGDWSPDFGNNLNWYMSKLIIGAPRNWAKTVLFWNIALDQNGGPTNGGCTDCRGVVTINKDNGTVSKNAEYYAIGHASKFVEPGAVRISTTHYNGILETVGYKNPDGSIVLIVANTSSNTESFQVNYKTEAFNYEMEPNSAVTFKWEG